MAERPSSLLLKFPGTNCDQETAAALRSAGFDTTIIPFADLTRDSIVGSQLVVIPGGFSYGDYIMSGQLAQLAIQRRIGDTLTRYRDDGGLIMGICNGFQILLRLGLLPSGSLIENNNARFICRWVRLKKTKATSPFLSYLPENFELPIAHAEGRFVSYPGCAETYLQSGLVPLQYRENPNGSEFDIAALQDETRRVFGLMPHPERFLRPEDHYDPAAMAAELSTGWGWGYWFFRSAFDAIQHRENNVPAAREFAGSGV